MIRNIARPEQCLIGSIIRNSDLYDEISSIINSSDFDDRFYENLYEIITEKIESSKTVDLISVSEDYEHRHGSDRFSEIAQIVNKTFGDKSVLHYAEMVNQNSTEKKLLAAAESIADLVTTEGDISKTIQTSQQLILDITEKRNQQDVKYSKDLIKAHINVMQARNDRDGSLSGISTGYANLDERTGGLRPGDFIVVAGRPSMGKTTLAMNIAENCVNNTSVLVFSLEMPAEQLIDRSIASRGRIDFGNIQTGRLTESEWQRFSPTAAKISELDLIIDDRAGISINDVRSTARKVSRGRKLGLIVVDYLQLMAGKGENRTQEVSAISGGLKALAKENNCPVIALSQLNRSVEQRADKRPIMSDLRDSGSIEQDADIIMFIYRDEVYNPDTQYKGIAELGFAKQRNGPIGVENMVFHGNFCRFDTYDGPPIEDEIPIKRSKAGFEYND